MQIEFALIGHQESWRAASDVLQVLRGPGLSPIPDDEVRDILPWIPPRAVCKVEVRSVQGITARGLYIDSFICPDRLESRFVQENLGRVRAAAAYASRARARVVSLGGFSSILVEGNCERLSDNTDTVFTTGNSLTVALIVQGIKKMCAMRERDLRDATLLIVGATGDVGSGCARCLGPLVRRVILCARNLERLRTLAEELRQDGIAAEITTDIEALREAPDLVPDLILCAASLPSSSLLLGSLAPGAIVCDAGYPKNLSPAATEATVFYGGLGQISAGLTSMPDLHRVLYHHPSAGVLHGCLLEGIALALERRYEPFSQGRGFITRERVQEIEDIAEGHGIVLAPIYNADGLLEEKMLIGQGVGR